MEQLSRSCCRNSLLAAILLVVVLSYFAVFTRFKLGDDIIQSPEDMNLIATGTGGKMKLLPKAQDPTLSSKFLSYDRHKVQHCLTHHTLGHLPVNIHSDEFSIPQLVNENPESVKSRKTSFRKVFSDRAWGHGSDKANDRLEASGPGSTLSWAQEVIATLHSLVNDLKISLGKSRIRILDLPCGDMAWMSRFLVTRDDIDYTGVDIVPELIANHRKAFRSQPWHFRLVDIIEHPLEEHFDIIVSRMMMQHLFYADAFRILKQFSDSNSTALLMTTFMRGQVNAELSVDNPIRFRWLNLGIPPLSLVPPLCVVRDGPPDKLEAWNHFVGLWELPLRRLSSCKHSNAMVLKGTDKTVYDCVKWVDM